MLLLKVKKLAFGPGVTDMCMSRQTVLTLEGGQIATIDFSPFIKRGHRVTLLDKQVFHWESGSIFRLWCLC
jgi:hypothetical protein